MDAAHRATPTAPTIKRLLLVCVHGFKGTDASAFAVLARDAPDAPGFDDLPQRLAYTLSHTFVDRMHVEPIVFPTYRTAGNFQDAVDDLVNWLVTQVGEREATLAADGPSKGACGIILMGHRCVRCTRPPFVRASTSRSIPGPYRRHD